MSQGKCFGFCQHPGCWDTGKKKNDHSYYASVLKSILAKRREKWMESHQDIPEADKRSNSLPTLTVNTLKSDQYLPPLAQRRLHMSVELGSPARSGAPRPGPDPRPLQTSVHKVGVRLDRPDPSGPWADWDFRPVYIWVPKQGRRPKPRSSNQKNALLKTTYLNKTVSIPNPAYKGKKLKSPEKNCAEDVDADLLTDLLKLSEEELVQLLTEADLSDSLGPEDRAAQRALVPAGKTAPGGCTQGDSSAPPTEEEEGEDRGVAGDTRPTAAVESSPSLGRQEESSTVQPAGKSSEPKTCVGSVRSLLADSPPPPQGTGGGAGNGGVAGPTDGSGDHPPSRADSTPLPYPVKPVVLVGPRGSGSIRRYPFGNPSLARVPRDPRHSPQALSLHSAGYYESTKVLSPLQEGLAGKLVSVQRCSLSPKTWQHAPCVSLPPLATGSTHVLPSTPPLPSSTHILSSPPLPTGSTHVLPSTPLSTGSTHVLPSTPPLPSSTHILSSTPLPTGSTHVLPSTPPLPSSTHILPSADELSHTTD